MRLSAMTLIRLSAQRLHGDRVDVHVRRFLVLLDSLNWIALERVSAWMCRHGCSGVDGVVGWCNVDAWNLLAKMNKYRSLILYNNLYATLQYAQKRIFEKRKFLRLR